MDSSTVRRATRTGDFPAEEDDVVEWKASSLREAGTHIMGRITYEDMAAVWPKSTGVYADLMNEIPKVVFSKTLTGRRLAREPDRRRRAR